MKAELIDVMGDDIRVVNAARVSFNKESTWEEVEESDGVIKNIFPGPEFIHIVKKYPTGLSLKDQKLIKYLASHNHWTPFSHVIITMRETVPIFVARQRFKHMVGFTYNEVSRRYVDDEPEFFFPDAWRKRAENKKQGSAEEFIKEEQLQLNQTLRTIYSFNLRAYKKLLEKGVAPEQARMILPQSMYTSYYVTGSLAAWARAYKLRINPHAQKEIQDLVKMWGDVIGNIKELKYSWKALING